MIESIRVVGAGGRVGSAVSARLARYGIRPRRRRSRADPSLRPRPRDLRSRSGDPRSVRGSRTSAARRRSRPSTRTSAGSRCTPSRRSRRLAARSSSTAPGQPSPRRRTTRSALGFWLAETLGLRPFELADASRAAYHAGAAVASNYLVTLRNAAGSLLEAAGAPPEALDPLMRRVIENHFELTGPIARGDWETLDRHLDGDPQRASRARAALPRSRRGDCGDGRERASRRDRLDRTRGARWTR